ncbi:hypothetical protein L2E82_22612 [Cichorium intybus]|uniref:Uncharacterized protein n=1 Tax=Cichorium intybus TaxID=13427 RepID=A0ACB9DXP6_CICIN|nr:hypothetical protein L2E82_22612 [Cichorium intybus]
MLVWSNRYQRWCNGAAVQFSPVVEEQSPTNQQPPEQQSPAAIAQSQESRSFQLHDVFNLDNENHPEDTPRLIDSKDNVFIMSNPKFKYPVLQLDLRLISDLVIRGYLLAGSVIGPGGLSFVNKLVQVETVAQFGVIFLHFALGLEFSSAKLRVVRAVAVLGGLLQIFLFMCLSGVIVVVHIYLTEFL